MNWIFIAVTVLFWSWPISVIIWRHTHRTKPKPVKNAYRSASPPPPEPVPPWFVRWWDWANTAGPGHWGRVRAAVPWTWIGIVLMVAASSVGLTMIVIAANPISSVSVSPAQADAPEKYPGWTCNNSGYWVPKRSSRYISEGGKLTLACSSGPQGQHQCTACDTDEGQIHCWNLERCP